MFVLLGGLYLGWSLGANDAANVFGTAVASRIVSFRNACILCSLAVMTGAVLQGEQGMETLSNMSFDSTTALLTISIVAAFTVTLMTIAGLPISTSQAVMGAIVGVGLTAGELYLDGLLKVVVCWVATPLGAMAISYVVYRLLGALVRALPMSLLTRDKILWGGLLVVGIYGSYALGANNVANVTGIFSGRIPGLTDRHLALLGGVAIAFGVLTYSKRVMLAVGSGVMRMDAFTALVAVLSMSITVHCFAIIGVPVSTSQGIVGAIVGIGMIRGAHVIRFSVLCRMMAGWVLTPVISLILAAAAYAVARGMGG